LRASARIFERNFEDRTDLQGRTTNIQLGLFRLLSPVSQIGIQFSNSKNEFDGISETYEIDNISFNYQKLLASGSVRATVGSGRVIRARGETSTGVLNLGWTRQVAPRSQLTLWAGQELTDTSELFRLGGGSAGSSFDNLGTSGLYGSLGNIGTSNSITDVRWRDVVLTPSPLERASIGLGFNYSGSRTSWSLSAGLSDDSVLDDPDLGNKAANLGFSAERAFGPRWNGRLQLSAWRQDFDLNDEEFDD